MIFKINEKVEKKLEEKNIRLEYSSLLNQTRQFIFRQENEDFAIIVPRKTDISEIEAIWTLAHEYGHYLIRTDTTLNEHYMSRLEVERLCWEKGKLLLEELDFPVTEDGNTYISFAEKCLDTYKIYGEDYRYKNAKDEKTILLSNIFLAFSKGFATVSNGIIIAYILLTTVNLEGEVGTFLSISILINIVVLILRYVMNKIP